MILCNLALKFINDRPIRTKISIGLSLIFLIFGIISATFFLNLNTEKKILDDVIQLSDNSAKILDINREISEIQRLVNVYGTTGGSSIIDKIENSFQSLTEKLNRVEATTKSSERREYIQSLLNILDAYGQNIDVLDERYTYKEQLIEADLPSAFKEGVSLLERGLEDTKTQDWSKEIAGFNILLKQWYEMDYYASRFLRSKDASYKEKYLSVERLIRDNKYFVKSFNEKVLEALDKYNDKFELSVQANRAYFSLVNVVMAGAAIEFSTISKRLRESSISNLELLLNASNENIETNRNVIIISLVVTLPLLIIIAIYFQLSIAKGITSISTTFNKFIHGDLDLDVPGLDRRDEIGEMAKAANAFREVSQKIKEEQARAQQLAESKSKFLAMMSHEIRTPMNAVLSCTHLLLDDTKDSEHFNLLQTIKTSGDSLLVLINDILDFSKIEAGKINLENDIFSLRGCIESVTDLFEQNAIKRDVRLEVEMAPDLPKFIRGDATRFRQVLVNLVGNGIKFTNSKVILKGQVLKRGGRNVKLFFSVQDDGLGIDQKSQETLFKEFSQVDASTTRKFGGTGLGLAICKGIVESMQGEIGVNSDKGTGSEFYFSFTTTIEDGDTVTPRSELSSHKLNISADRSIKILMAEDNSINQMVAQKMIEKLGYRVDVVSDGNEAVAAVKKQNYDLVFMDQHMPELDGVEATKIIRTLNIPQPMIVALTASAFKEDHDRCLDAGMDEFLAKPIVVQHLINILNRFSEEHSEDIIVATTPQHDPVDKAGKSMLDKVYSNFSGDEDLVSEILSLLSKQLPSKLQSLEEAITSLDCALVKSESHFLKGQFLNIGLPEISAPCGALEKMAIENNLGHARDEFNKLRDLAYKLLKELKVDTHQS